MYYAFLAALTAFATTTLAPVYAPTPQAAALRVLGGTGHVARTNVVGDFATVLVPDGEMEGSRTNDAALLLQRFSFGWQAIESLNVRCRLDDHVTDPAAQHALLAGMPTPQREQACAPGSARDVGPQDEVATIRQLVQGPLVPTVRVVGRYALGGWYGGGGGVTLFRRDPDGWHVVMGGGGAMDADDLRQHGVPPASVCALLLECPKR